jgi:RNA polymerase sigma-70 factor (ECF subfamily)
MNAVDIQRFEDHRPYMFAIAYRMLGSITEAEDILQEAFLRYQAASTRQIVSLKAILSTIVTRLCLNRLKSAQLQRETYLGPWLPEPLLTDTDEQFDAVHQAELHESLSLAFLVLLEQLTPLERAVFLLHQVFDYEYAEIATMIGKEEATCRQLFSRAKRHIAEHRPRFKSTPEAHRQMLQRFVEAISRGDLDRLLQLLSDDVMLWADGGGKARGAAIHPLHGHEAVARFLLASPRLVAGPIHASVMDVNGEPALVLRAEGSVHTVMTISLDHERVYEIRLIGNPDKLRGMNRAQAN